LLVQLTIVVVQVQASLAASQQDVLVLDQADLSCTHPNPSENQTGTQTTCAMQQRFPMFVRKINQSNNQSAACEHSMF